MVDQTQAPPVIRLKFSWFTENSVNVKAVRKSQKLNRDIELLSRTFNLPEDDKVREAIVKERAGEFCRELLGERDEDIFDAFVEELSK